MKPRTLSPIQGGLLLGALLVTLATRPAAQCQKDTIVSDTGWLVAASGPACVAQDGDTLVVGSSFVFPGSSFAYVFDHGSGAWVQEAELVPSAPDDLMFGYSVAVSGDTVAVGSPAERVDGFDDVGAVYVFRRVAGAWTLEQKLLPPGPREPRLGFGWSLALEGDRLLVGMPRDSVMTTFTEPGEPGNVHVYERTGGVWTLQQSLGASDAVPGWLDRFGYALSLEGSRLVVGAPEDHPYPPPAEGPGAVYVLEHDGSSWVERQILHARHPYEGAGFGSFVSLNGGRLAVAQLGVEWPGLIPEPGAAFVFYEFGGTWYQEAEIVPDDQDGYKRFAASIALHDPYLLVGAPGDQDAGVSAGCAYVYEWNGSSWQERKKLYGDDVVFGDGSGLAVAWHEGPAFVAGNGIVYAFELDPACPDAAFSADPRSGYLPLAVQFTDLSTGTVDEWGWSFGDGGTSTAQHPLYTYAAQPGEHTVSLVVRGPGGVDRGIEVGYVTVDSAAASVTLRNGFGINRQDYLDMGDLPILGTDWTPVVAAMDLSNPLLAHVAASFRPHPGLPVPFGELLILPPLIARWNVPMPLGVVEVVIPIPNELSLIGVEVSTQGGVTWSEQGRLEFALMNALDLVLGL